MENVYTNVIRQQEAALSSLRAEAARLQSILNALNWTSKSFMDYMDRLAGIQMEMADIQRAIRTNANQLELYRHGR